MKKIVLFTLASLIISSCGLNKQARQIEALEKCTYDIASADSIFLAGRDVSRLVNKKSFQIQDVPEFAVALFRRNLPLKARINLKITNPTSTLAAINQFEYIVLIKGQEIANGFVNQNVKVEPGSSTTVPVQVNSNIYSFVSNGNTMQEILEFMRGSESGVNEKKGVVTLKIKPTIEVGNQLVKYPGYITVDKEISSKILF